MASTELTETKSEDVRTHPNCVVTPLVDIYESPDALLVQLDVPGVAKEDIDLRFDRGLLTIEAHKGDFGYHRTFVLREDFDVEGITAAVTHGVLNVTVPKAARAKPRQIEIKAV